MVHSKPCRENSSLSLKLKWILPVTEILGDLFTMKKTNKKVMFFRNAAASVNQIEVLTEFHKLKGGGIDHNYSNCKVDANMKPFEDPMDDSNCLIRSKFYKIWGRL